MALFDLYSKRRRRERGEFPDVYQYAEIPEALRVQIVHVWKSTFNLEFHYDAALQLFQQIHDILCREYGLFDLKEGRGSYFDHVANFMLKSGDTERVLVVT